MQGTAQGAAERTEELVKPRFPRIDRQCVWLVLGWFQWGFLRKRFLSSSVGRREQPDTWTQDSPRRQLEQWGLGLRSLDLAQKDMVSDPYHVPWTHFLMFSEHKFPHLRNNGSS